MRIGVAILREELTQESGKNDDDYTLTLLDFIDSEKMRGFHGSGHL